MEKNIIAIDPSWENTGICINYEKIEKQVFSFSPQKKVTGVSGKVLKKTEKDYDKFYKIIVACVDFRKINVIVVNDMFSINHNTLKSLFELVGIIKLIASQYNCEIVIFNEAKVRKKMTGYGGNDRKKSKKLSIDYAKKTSEEIKNDDESDALMLFNYFLEVENDGKKDNL